MRTMLALITDSSSNITCEEAERLGITLIPLTIIFGSQEYRDGIDIDCDEFYKKLTTSKEFPHTAQLSENQIEEAIKNVLKPGVEVLIMPISSALSGSHDRCVKVASQFENVYVYDTKCTTVMLKMLVLEALANAEKPVAEIMKILDSYRPKIKLFAALETLEYLSKGGRLSKTGALLGTMLKIKPVVTLNLEGEVELLSKQFGMNKGISNIAGMVDKNKIDFSKPVYEIYTMNDANSATLINKIGVPCTEKINICPVIGTHIGPHAAGFVYAEK